MIHYAALGEERTACSKHCKAPSEEEHTTRNLGDPVDVGLGHAGYIGRPVFWATLDPREANCPECVANMPDVPACACGAPALYGAAYNVQWPDESDPPQYCAEHAPDDCRCMTCRAPLLDASESYCARHMDEDNGRDGITEWGGVAC